jgi:prepilin-type N-terminal cleavage/methylation domain-containing protein
MKNQKGVTLIELIIVFVIIAIGAVLTVPSINAWVPNYRLKSATRDIVSALRTAQMKAVANNLTYRVSFTQPNSFVIQYQTTSGSWVDDCETQTLPSGIQFNTTFGNTINFLPNSTSTGGNIILTNPKGSTKTIQILGSTGRIKIG